MRVASEASRQDSAAFAAAATAASTTADVAKATWACCAPVAGFMTAPQRSTGPSQLLPPIQCRISASAVPAAFFASTVLAIATSVTR